MPFTTSITGNPTTGAAPLLVNFSGVSDIPDITSYNWDFGDESTGTGETTSHSYSLPGSYTTVLTVSGVQYSGSYFYDDFSSGFLPFWNTDFTDAYSIISTPSGNAAKFDGGGATENMRMLSPWGVHISGDFSLETMMVVSGTLAGTNPSIGILTYSGDTGLEGAHWLRETYDNLYEVAELRFDTSSVAAVLTTYEATVATGGVITSTSLNDQIGLKIVRENGTISGYYKDGVTGAWTAMSTPISYSDKAVLQINGCSYVSFLYIKSTAEEGLSYDATLSGSVYDNGNTPDWVELDTYMYDNFANNNFSPYWDSDFAGGTIDDENGYYANPGINDHTLIPSGGAANLSGDIDIQLDFVMAPTGGDESLRIEPKLSGGANLHTVTWFNDDLYIDGSATIDAPQTIGRRYTVRTMRGYYLSDSGVLTEEIPHSGWHSYYLDNWSGGATNTWREFSTSPTTTAGWDDPVYVDLNGADYNGFDNFKLQASEGLPLTPASPILIGDSSLAIGLSEATLLSDTDSLSIFSVSIEPVPSGTALSTYTPILMNKRRYVYKRGGGDSLQTKLSIFHGKKLAYLSDIPVEFWLNYSGSWLKYEDYTTNRYGLAHMTHATDDIPNIDCCLGLARAIIDGNTYNSNLVRFNFV